MPKYNTNTFHVNPRTCKDIMQQDGQSLFPSKHTDYYLYNVGSTTLKVALKSGNSLMWTKTLKTVNLEPGQEAVLDVSKYMCLTSGVQVTNSDGKNGFVHCSQVTGYPFYDECDATVSIDIEAISKVLVTFGVANIPKRVDDFNAVVKFFWPENKESVWDKISSLVLHLLDDDFKDYVKTVLTKDIAKLKESIDKFNTTIDAHNKFSAQQYMSLVDEIVNIERKFVLNKNKTPDYIKINYILLPFYSTVVNLKLKIYQFGLVHQNNTTFTDVDLIRIRGYAQNLVHDSDVGAIAYVESVLVDTLEFEYQHVHSELLYDTLVTVRAYVSLNGLEFFPLWRAIVEDPESTNEPHNNTIVFSSYYGRPTPVLHRQMVRDDHSAPFKPQLINGRRNQPQKIIVYTLLDSVLNEPKIAGLAVTYINGDEATTGKLTTNGSIVDFNNAHLVKLIVWGWGQVDGLEFVFCDNRRVKVGTTESNDYHIFELQNHHIIGFFLANDFPKLEGQAANICVSYQLCEYESEHEAQDKCSILR